MLIKFDFSSKTGVLVVKFAFATANLKIETLRMRRRFARVFREIPSLSFVCGANFFEFRGRNLVCFVIAYNFNGKYATEAGKTRMRTAFFTRASLQLLYKTRGYAKRRNVFLAGTSICECVTHSGVDTVRNYSARTRALEVARRHVGIVTEPDAM